MRRIADSWLMSCHQVELRTAMEEYNHVVLTIPSPTLSTSTMSRQSGDADWESVDGETGGTGAEAQAMSAGEARSRTNCACCGHSCSRG